LNETRNIRGGGRDEERSERRNERGRGNEGMRG